MISVCIATYNGEKYIRQQMDSILSQIGEADEVIVSDDGSTDATLAILDSYHDSRIQVYKHDSKTVTTTFPLDRPTHNFENALRQAHGDIIFLSDQDDVWLDGKVKAMVSALQNADMAVHDCMVVSPDMKMVCPSYFDHIKIHQGVLRNSIRCTYLGCCMAMKRCVVEAALPFPKTKIGHDLWLGIVADMKFRTLLVRQPLLMYRKHPNSMTTSGFKSQYSLRFKIDYRMEILRNVLKLYLRRS